MEYPPSTKYTYSIIREFFIQAKLPGLGKTTLPFVNSSQCLFQQTNTPVIPYPVRAECREVFAVR